MNREFRERDLIRAMFETSDVPPGRYERLYTTSPTFKYGVDYLAQALIPTFLRGLAVNAAEWDELHRVQLHEMAAKLPSVEDLKDTAEYRTMFGPPEEEEQ